MDRSFDNSARLNASKKLAEQFLGKRHRHLDRDAIDAEANRTSETLAFTGFVPIRKLLLDRDGVIGSLGLTTELSEHADRFRNLVEAVIGLADRSELNVPALRDGRQFLPTLIEGLREEENFMKSQLAPEKIQKTLSELEPRHRVLGTEPSISEVEREQQANLLSYYSHRHSRELLETLLSVVEQIDYVLGGDQPSKSLSGPSL